LFSDCWYIYFDYTQPTIPATLKELTYIDSQY